MKQIISWAIFFFILVLFSNCATSPIDSSLVKEKSDVEVSEKEKKRVSAKGDKNLQNIQLEMDFANDVKAIDESKTVSKKDALVLTNETKGKNLSKGIKELKNVDFSSESGGNISEIDKGDMFHSPKSSNSNPLIENEQKSDLEKKSDRKTFFDPADELLGRDKKEDRKLTEIENKSETEKNLKIKDQKILMTENETVQNDLPILNDSKNKEDTTKFVELKSSKILGQKISGSDLSNEDSYVKETSRQVSFRTIAEEDAFKEGEGSRLIGFKKGGEKVKPGEFGSALKIKFSSRLNMPNKDLGEKSYLAPSGNSEKLMEYERIRTFLNRPQLSSVDDEVEGQNQYPNSVHYLGNRANNEYAPVLNESKKAEPLRYLKSLEWIQSRGRVKGKGGAE